MAKQLLSSFGIRGATSYTTTGIAQGLDQVKVDIEDTAYLSKYFKVVEFNPVFTAGKNSISFNGSDLLKDGSEIMVEVLDKDGNSLYLTAPPRKTNYVDIANFTVAIHVYKETVAGAGKVILVGTTAKNEIVRWMGNITLNTTYQNVSRVRFFNAPYMEAQPLLYPVIENLTGSQLTTEVTVSGSFWLEVQNANGYFTPGNVNYGGTLPASAQIILWAYQGTDPNNRVDAFNSQMNGATITLHYDVANTQVPTVPPVWQYRHYDETSTILNVRSTTEVQIDTIPLGPIAQLSSSGGRFTCSYNRVEYIRQATTIPCTAVHIGTAPGDYNEVAVNSDAFTASMVGENVTMKYSSIFLQGSPYPAFNPAIKTTHNHWPVTASQFTILSVTGSRFIHTAPFVYTMRDSTGFGYQAVNYTASRVTGSITFLSSSNPYQGYVNSAGSSSMMKKSYVNIIYRNLDTFSGYVARHKLYARSNIYPGNYELIDDTVLGPSELLVDPITANKNFSTIGNFTNQDMVNQYWFASSASINLLYSDKPVLNSMTIRPTPDYSAADGNSYVIVKAGSYGVTNDENYHPYDAAEYVQFSGTGYTSNFIFLASGVLYMLSANMIVNKNVDQTAKIMFFFTSSIESIQKEQTYTPPFGYKLGEIVVADKVKSRVFGDVQKLFFTPLDDYYGTMLIVPVNCEVILSNVSLKNYGDHGFSPKTCIVQIPFPINIANEKWSLKSELFDSNYNLIYSVPAIEKAFDPQGASLFGSNTLGTSGGSSGVPTYLTTLTVGGQLYLPGITPAVNPKRLLSYQIPQHSPPLSGEGAVTYTQVSELSLKPTNDSVSTKDYINVETVEAGTPYFGRSIAVRYSGSTPSVYGRRVYVDQLGNKTTYL